MNVRTVFTLPAAPHDLHTRKRFVSRVVRLARSYASRLRSRLEHYVASLHEDWWDRRAGKVARMIPPRSRVIGFGRGHAELQRGLDSSCTYIRSHPAEADARTFICDLNHRPLPDMSHLHVDTAVFFGALEYVRDLESLVFWLTQSVSLCVVSYACRADDQGAIRRFVAECARFYCGYRNGYREEEVVDLFRRAGFRCIGHDAWTSLHVFLFVSQRPSD
jgi:hypothetical protein